jgi:DNA adenine methylase
MAKPFLKWAGGKTSLLPELLQAAPDQIETYYEPFLGGGALFFALQAEGRFKRAVLSDSNEELINAYTQVRDNVDRLIRALLVHQTKYRNSEDQAEYYYTIRGKKLTCDLGGTANLIFLNKTCFNGLYRVNSKGDFNVPHGRHQNPTICDEGNLRAVSEALKNVELRVADFADAPSAAGQGDFVYFDPPYVPLSETAHFTSYTAKEFGSSEQRRLAQTAAALTNRGATVVLSNSNHPEVSALYESHDFSLHEVQAPRNINSRATRRGAVREFLIKTA